MAAGGDGSAVDSWRTILMQEVLRLDLDNALILADDKAATALACAVGLPALLEHRAANVLRLGEPFTLEDADEVSLSMYTDERPTHVIVLCSTFLPEAYEALRNSLCTGLPIARCTIA